MSTFGEGLDALRANASDTKQAVFKQHDWKPGVVMDGATGLITTEPMSSPPKDNDWVKVLEIWDLDPEEFEVVEPVQFRAWDGPIAGGTVRRMYYYRATIRRRRFGANVKELLKMLGKVKAPVYYPSVNLDLPAFVVATADTQLGDGETERVIERFKRLTLLAVASYKDALKRGRCCKEIVLPWLGDCIQGVVTSAPILKNDMTIVEMVTVFRRLLQWQVQQFMDLGHVTVVIVPGNHDQPMRNPAGKGPMYSADQSWAVAAGVAVSDAFKLAGRDDITFVFPEPERSTVTIDIAGTVVAMAHGHQWGGPAHKIHDWWAGQSHGRSPVGAADILLTGHRHHFFSEVAGKDRLAMVVPPLVSTTDYWHESSGDDTAPGMVVMLVGQGRWAGLEILA